MARRTITARIILQMHRLHRCGNSFQQIAEACEVERRTVSRYINQEVDVSPSLQEAIDSLQWYAEPQRVQRKEAPAGYLTMREAAKLMPTHPSQQFMRNLIRDGRLEGHRIDGMLCTTAKWVDTYIRANYGRLPAVVAVAMPMIPLTLSPSPSLHECMRLLSDGALSVRAVPCVPVETIIATALNSGYQCGLVPLSTTRFRVLWRTAEVERALAGMI